MSPAPNRVRVGISGWTYPPWRGVFYPPKWPQSKELEFAAERFRAIEVNGTFYGMQRPDVFADWAARTPDDFIFALKGPRYITHMLALRGAAPALANFLASGLLRLGAKLGPILWQFPPRFAFDAERLAPFLALLPHDTEQAAALARTREARMDGRDWTKTDAARPLRHAIEVRHESFRDARFVDLLRQYRVALVCADTVEWPRLMDVTADFFYCRLHGSEQLYASGYDAAALAAWARRFKAWAKGSEPTDAERVGPASAKSVPRDVFVFFDNDAKVRAPADATALARLLKLG